MDLIFIAFCFNDRMIINETPLFKYPCKSPELLAELGCLQNSSELRRDAAVLVFDPHRNLGRIEQAERVWNCTWRR